MTSYTAPATQVLTLVHVDTGAGVTVCGLEQRDDQVWLRLDLRDGDRVCPACAGQEPSVQEPELW